MGEDIKGFAVGDSVNQIIEPNEPFVRGDPGFAGELGWLPGLRLRGRRVPLVDDGVELDTGVGARPRRIGDPPPEITGLDRLANLAVVRSTSSQSPSSMTSRTKSLGTRAELLEFCPDTVAYASPLKSAG